MDALGVFVNKPFKKSFDTAFIKNIKIVKKINCFFFFFHKTFLKNEVITNLVSKHKAITNKGGQD